MVATTRSSSSQPSHTCTLRKPKEKPSKVQLNARAHAKAASRSSPPSRTSTLPIPKQEELSELQLNTRARAKYFLSAKTFFVKEEEEREEQSSFAKTRSSTKKKNRAGTEKVCYYEADELENDDDNDGDDDNDPDYGNSSEVEDESKQEKVGVLPQGTPTVVAPTSEYESLRMQRIAENKARLEALGVQKHAASLTSFFQVSKPKRSWTKSPSTPLELRRRSERLITSSSPPGGFYSPASSDSDASEIEDSPKLKIVSRKRVYRNYGDEGTRRPGNAPLPKNCPADLQISPLMSALRCRSKERGTLYDAIVGICCHFCRQKKLCGEEDCERCGPRDVTKACSGKSDCTKCHSSTGVFCRACLKIRYGEDIDDVRERNDWICAHCSEEQGLNPYWICNSSICLAKRKIPPTGIAIYKAREMGFESVAHYLADFLRGKQFKRLVQ